MEKYIHIKDDRHKTRYWISIVEKQGNKNLSHYHRRSYEEILKEASIYLFKEQIIKLKKAISDQ